MIILSPKAKRAKRVRTKLSSNLGIPRLTVFRSNIHIWAQVIDDKHGRTLVSASSKSLVLSSKKQLNKIDQATAVGRQIAKNALKAKIQKVRFDRGPYLYHGRVKALAQAARKEGLIF